MFNWKFYFKFRKKYGKKQIIFMDLRKSQVLWLSPLLRSVIAQVLFCHQFFKYVMKKLVDHLVYFSREAVLAIESAIWCARCRVHLFVCIGYRWKWIHKCIWLYVPMQIFCINVCVCIFMMWKYIRYESFVLICYIEYRCIDSWWLVWSALFCRSEYFENIWNYVQLYALSVSPCSQSEH